MENYKLFVFLILLGCSTFTSAQGFQSKIIAGVNASQLEGDQLSGFDKVGVQLGIGIEYKLLKNSISIELLYNQKGSTEKRSSQVPIRANTTLNYAQIPLLFHLNSWYNEEGFYHIGLDAGPYVSRLITAKSNSFDTSADGFKQMDYGFVFGVRYKMTQHAAVAIRYDQSVSEIYNIPFSAESGLLSYLVSLRFEYHL